jgi:hypothetical protein
VSAVTRCWCLGPTAPRASMTHADADSTGAMRGCPHPLTCTRQAPWPSHSTWTPRRFNCTPHRFKLEIPSGEELFVLGAACLWPFNGSYNRDGSTGVISQARLLSRVVVSPHFGRRITYDAKAVV